MIIYAVSLLLLLLALAIPVAATLGGIGLLLGWQFTPLPIHRGVGEIVWAAVSDPLLVTIPMFIMMGEILLRSGIAANMYRSVALWLSWLPGGLMHSNIGSSALFAAVSGSSVATAATIGTVAVSEIDKHGYNERLFLGSIAAGGTIGIMIPPSINLIVYGVLTDTSIPQLFLAGLVPGILMSLVFITTIILICLIKPGYGGDRIQATFAERIAALPDFLPPIFIFAIVIGSIYAGVATPTESAALGTFASLVLVAFKRRLNWRVLAMAAQGTMKSTAMIMAIIIAAKFLNFALTAVGFIGAFKSTIHGIGLDPFPTLLIIIAFYLVLGMFMETLSMMVITVPIVVPVLVSMGYDAIWLGILIILLIETAMITPPVGINLFVVQGVRGRGSVADLMIGAIPFVAALMVMIVLIIVVPDIALWLPNSSG
ncbi:hypothetical protein AB838_22070 [Rhodobacteraceae bacterium (ex Bugula neritina AB1)]|nr:hypothetical protein AB838_22070 [Rhodobacteraceae bacterium (ex Bugula neritina AB1)]